MIYRKRKTQEQSLQEWLTLYLNSIGVLFCASAGGMRTSIGTAVKMKRAGYKKGFPDIGIYEPRGTYHGLFIELKCDNKSGPTDEQTEWQAELAKRGYLAKIVPHRLSFREAQEWIERVVYEYLQLKK